MQTIENIDKKVEDECHKIQDRWDKIHCEYNRRRNYRLIRHSIIFSLITSLPLYFLSHFFNMPIGLGYCGGVIIGYIYMGIQTIRDNKWYEKNNFSAIKKEMFKDET